MKVELLNYTPAPEATVATAAKLCYSAASIETLREKIDDKQAAEFTRMLAEIGHESPIEHVSFTFGIEGVSRALLAQITRHRIASYSVQSQRYVKEFQFEYIIPPAIEGNSDAKKEYLDAMEKSQRAYEKIEKLLYEQHLGTLIDSGAEEEKAKKQAEKTAIEDARFVLPNACATKMIVTMNARSLLNFFRHRLCNRAQWEIRALAKQMLRLVLQAAPSLFDSAGPGCIQGNCPEGKMSCGKMQQVRAEFGHLKER